MVVGCGKAPFSGEKGAWPCLYGGSVLLSHTLSSAVPSALVGLASGFGMGPGVSPPLLPPPKIWGHISHVNMKF